MIRLRSRFLLLVAFLVLMGGCRKEDVAREPGVYVSENTKLRESLSSRSVFLKVNGEAIRKRDFDALATLYDKVNRMRAKDPLVGANPQAERAIRLQSNAIVAGMLRRTLLRQLAEKEHVTASPEALKAGEAAMLKHLRREDSSLQAVAKEIGGKPGQLIFTLNEGDALEAALRDHFDTEHELKITAKDIADARQRAIQISEAGAASNIIEKAELEKAKKEIAAGVRFEEVAKKYSTVYPEEGREWGEFELKEFEDNPAFQKWLVGAKTGDISDIMEMDDGWSIVKVEFRTVEELPPGSLAIPRDLWTLVRVTRRLWEILPEYTDEELTDFLLAKRMPKIQRKIGDLIMKEAVIEWPYGTNLFKKVEAPALPPGVPPVPISAP
ncbi:MAG: peptidylprolyl isomerase [Kiritimatiellae bacterium]|nr:peptidylprolyl isomerase [Kiritimatiellia bacterium]